MPIECGLRRLEDEHTPAVELSFLAPVSWEELAGERLARDGTHGVGAGFHLVASLFARMNPLRFSSLRYWAFSLSHSKPCLIRSSSNNRNRSRPLAASRVYTSFPVVPLETPDKTDAVRASVAEYFHDPHEATSCFSSALCFRQTCIMPPS